MSVTTQQLPESVQVNFLQMGPKPASRYYHTVTSTAVPKTTGGLNDTVPFISDEIRWVPSIVITFINTLIAQSYESSLPGREYTFVSYLSSYYSFLCMAMAIILNRTMFFGTTRANTNIRIRVEELQRNRGYSQSGVRSLINKNRVAKLSKILLRVVAFCFLFQSMHVLLICLNCYHAPSHELLKRFEIFQYKLQSWRGSILKPFLVPNALYKITKDVVAGKNGIAKFGPSTSVLGFVYFSLCVSQFVETIIAAVTGKTPQIDPCINLFELSLAYHEFDNLLLIDRIPNFEILFVSVLVVLNHILSHSMNSLGLQNYRLINSSFAHISLLAFYVKCVLTSSLFKLPTTLQVTFIPQLVTISIICMSSVIYAISYLLTDDNHSNITFNSLGFEDLNIVMKDDFPELLHKLSVIAFSATVKKSYIKELEFIGAPTASWLDSKLELIENGKKTRKQKNSLLKKFRSERNSSGSNYDNMVKVPDDYFEKVKGKPNQYTNPVSHIFRRFLSTLALLKYFGLFLLALIFKRKTIENQKEVLEKKTALLSSDVDFYDEAEQTVDYDQFLNGRLAPENDDTSDFEFDDLDEDDVELEEDTEVESELGDAEENANNLSIVQEVLTAEDILKYLGKDTLDRDIMASHLEKRTTRSQFKKEQSKSSEDETEKLVELIKEKRKWKTNASYDQEDEDLKLVKQFQCVVCQSRPREIIMWPCRCFSVCENCRLTLVLRNFENCVCCRSKISGYSKVYLP